MRVAAFALLLSTISLAACSSNLPHVINPGATQGFELSPSPVELTNDNPVSSFTVQNDVPGVSYTPTADPSCETASGGIYVGGDGQAQVDAAGSPVIFAVFAAGTPPSSCTITVKSSDGLSSTVDATYQVLTVQSVVQDVAHVMVSSAGVSPASATISKITQMVSLSASGFSGTITSSTSGCPSGATGLQVNPKTASGGSGTFSVVAYGQGALSFSCSVKLTDSANTVVSVPITVAIAALSKFTVTPTSIQFGCAGSTLPKHCQSIQTLTLQETGASKFAVADKPALQKTCANAFNGPLKFVVNGGSPVLTVPGPTASVSLDGLLPTAGLSCSRVVLTDNGDPAQTVNVSVNSTLASAPPPSISAAAAPPCKGNDPFVAMPGAVHGMYVWNPNHYGKYQAPLANDVIGKDKDPTLCGASLVILWSDLQPTKGGSFNWSYITDAAAPYTSKGLIVNLLFADVTEGTTNNVTPAWVTDPKSQGGDGVPTITCPSGTAAIPVFWNQQYEADWENVITTVIKHYTGDPNIGYLRFASGEGAEAVLPSGIHSTACSGQWSTAGWSYDAWQQHELNILNTVGGQTTDKQLMMSLPSVPDAVPAGDKVPGVPDLYDMPNAFAAVAASKHVGLSFESLGAAPVTPPGPCNPQAKIQILHWCQAYHTYAGVVPLAMQPITASTENGTVNFNLTDLVQYALDNNIQIFEMYPAEWIQADSPEGPDYINKPAQYKAALQAAALVLGTAQ